MASIKIPVWILHAFSIFLITFLFFAVVFEWKIYIQEYVGFPKPTTESPMNTTTLKTKTDECRWDSFINTRTRDAESNWIRARRKQEKIANQILNEGSQLTDFGLVNIWDLFYPSFSCPFTTERIGRVGDGGKWVCGFLENVAHKSPCVVYSFGIGEEVTFEKEILRRSKNCIIRMFDHTIPGSPSLVREYPGRAFWYPLGISNKTSGQMSTLNDIMESHQDEFIEILKVDTEGAEWEALKQILKDFPNTLPFSQLLMEIDLLSGSDTQKTKFFLDYSKTLEDEGVAGFYSELNYGALEAHCCSEFSFLNINMLGRGREESYKTGE